MANRQWTKVLTVMVLGALLAEAPWLNSLRMRMGPWEVIAESF
jgi:hypothetical protein